MLTGGLLVKTKNATVTLRMMKYACTKDHEEKNK